jgi:hypothetical protein
VASTRDPASVIDFVTPPDECQTRATDPGARRPCASPALNPARPKGRPQHLREVRVGPQHLRRRAGGPAPHPATVWFAICSFFDRNVARSPQTWTLGREVDRLGRSRRGMAPRGALLREPLSAADRVLHPEGHSRAADPARRRRGEPELCPRRADVREAWAATVPTSASFGLGFRFYRPQGAYWDARALDGIQIAYAPEGGLRLLFGMAAF